MSANPFLNTTRLGKSILRISDCMHVLSPHGYELSFYCPRMPAGGPTAAFVRRTQHKGIFDQVFVTVTIDGKGVGAWVRLSIVPTGNQWPGTFEDDAIVPVHGDTTSGALRSKTEKAAWLDSVLSTAPAHCERLLQSIQGSKLIENTRRSRELSDRYRSLLPSSIEALDAFWAMQKLSANAIQRQHAKNMLRLSLLDIPWTTREEEDRVYFAYQIATYTIILNEGAFDNSFGSTIDPSENIELAWCIQILASWIHSPHLWP